MVIKNGQAVSCGHYRYDETVRRYLPCGRLANIEHNGQYYCLKHFKADPTIRCMECGCQTSDKIDYNGQGYWVCPRCDRKLEREFETFEN